MAEQQGVYLSTLERANNMEGEGGIFVPINLELIDWGSVLKRVAKKLHEEISNTVLVDGISIEDIIQDTVYLFLKGEKTTGWDPTKIKNQLSLEEGVANFLIGMISHKRTDLFRSYSGRNKHPRHLDDREESRSGENNPGLPAKFMASKSLTTESEVLGREIQRRLISLMPNDALAIAVITAAVDTTGSGKVDQELAENVLGAASGVRKIVNAKKRIHRAIKKDERFFLWLNKTTTTLREQERMDPTG